MIDGDLQARLAAAGVEMSGERVGLLGRYLDVLWEWRTAVNLTGISDRSEAVSTLIIGALEPIRVGLVAPGPNIVDVGSGSGSPGIPLAIAWPDADLTLVESDQRKVAFLRHVGATLRLGNVRVVHGRAEVLGHESGRREQFDLATARALAAPPRACELTLPFVRSGGEAWLYLSARDGEALEAARGSLAPLGVSDVRVAPTALGCLAVMCKDRAGDATYPRAERPARRRPLF